LQEPFKGVTTDGKELNCKRRASEATR
jgi:hypothetical protein